MQRGDLPLPPCVVDDGYLQMAMVVLGCLTYYNVVLTIGHLQKKPTNSVLSQAGLYLQFWLIAITMGTADKCHIIALIGFFLQTKIKIFGVYCQIIQNIF